MHIFHLKFLFRVVACLEATYALLAFMPLSWVEPATGWALSPDGHWITKLLGAALASQALVAWVLRDEPHRGVAKAFAFYQFASSAVDVLIWLGLPGAFASMQAQVGVLVAVPTHLLLGTLILVSLSRRPE